MSWIRISLGEFIAKVKIPTECSILQSWYEGNTYLTTHQELGFQGHNFIKEYKTQL